MVENKNNFVNIIKCLFVIVSTPMAIVNNHNIRQALDTLIHIV